ncbi:fasciclin domain-containing protein [Micropruina sonneratiae]|uniref:fasciclin domain-containing protein n=1 Tax=Micropruina sonneratiae TaxID=2986940 RepID=UPI0022271474|nr:fasciclin domain-containing protein [Micropruina sp. KQZ13P-5]MCW3158856.1 fasciclin domain-containing protein [Micropruina sp. KQZ13P-5]
MRTSIRIAGLSAALLLPLAACSTTATPMSSGSEPMTSSSSMPMTSSSSMPMSPSMGASDTAMAQFGPGCASVPTSGAGSFEGMAKDPVATAASNNPALSTLVTAVKKAGLVDTLNNASDITVFAPVDDAFAKLPKKDLDAALKDKKMLTKILTNHVVEGRLSPDQLAGEHKTLAGGTITVTGSGEDFMVGEATVVCGNVQTANATVYLIDGVLMPSM